MNKLFGLLRKYLESGENAVIATIIASSGSTPRGAGARMLVTEEGRKYGTIGGGAVELHSEKIAKDVLKAKTSRIEAYRLHKNEVQDLGMICGGNVNVFFHYVDAGDSGMLELVKLIELLYKQREESWLITDITPNGEAGAGIYSAKRGLVGVKLSEEGIGKLQNKPLQIEEEGRLFYCERLVQGGRVYIFGGGHVTQALVPVLSSVDFSCVVLEDRPDFCEPDLFLNLAETHLIDNNRVLDYISVTDSDYVVIMTRGHKDDQIIQAQILKTPARYIGVIGSRRKSAGVFTNLRKQGFTHNDLKRIKTPIGLEIKAETPAEIAVSITAEMILERAKI